MPPENTVDVSLQNFILRVSGFNAFSQSYFCQFGMQVALPVVVRNFSELYRQGGSTLRGSLVLEHLRKGAAHAYPVHAAMVVKAVVFAQEQGINKNGRNFLKGYPLAVFPVQGSDGAVFTVQNHRAFRDVALYLGNVIAVGNGAVKKHQDGSDHDADEAASQKDAQGPANEPADIPRQGAENRETRPAHGSCACGTVFFFSFRIVFVLFLRRRAGGSSLGRRVIPGRTVAGIPRSAGRAGNNGRLRIFLRQPGIGWTGQGPFFAFRLGTGRHFSILDAFPPGGGISFP